MKTNPTDKNKQKFNKSTSALSNWPFKARRKDVTKHPVIQSKESCFNRLGSMWSQQEELMVKGITNHLQCEPREAIRISLYEASLAPHKAHESCYIYAASGSKEAGHTGRNRKGSVALPKSEKDLVLAASKQLGITDKEFIRLAVIWIAYGMRDESFKLTNTKNIGEFKAMKDYRKNNPEKSSQPSTIQPLLDAQKKGIERVEEKKEEIWKDMEVAEEYRMSVGKDQPGLSYEAHKLLIESEAQDTFEQLIRDEVERLDLNKTDERIMRYESWGLTHEEAIAAAMQEEESDEPMTTEEWDALAEQIGLESLGSELETKPKVPVIPRPKHQQPTEGEINKTLKNEIERETRFLDLDRERGTNYGNEETLNTYKRRLNMRTFWDDHL